MTDVYESVSESAHFGFNESCATSKCQHKNLQRIICTKQCFCLTSMAAVASCEAGSAAMGPAGTSGDQAGAKQTPVVPPTGTESQVENCAKDGKKYAVVTAPKVQQQCLKTKNKKKPTALDRQYRLVASIQRRNRQHAAEKQENDQQKRLQQQRLADFSHQLRTMILAGDVDTLKQTWQPVADAARLREAQHETADQTQQLPARLPHGQTSPAANVLDPDTLRPKRILATSKKATASAAEGGGATAAEEPQQSGLALASSRLSAADDVDAFLDSLLQQATAIKAAPNSNSETPPQPSSTTPATISAAQPSQQYPAGNDISRPSTAASNTSKRTQQSKSKPAWALSEQQQADAEAAAEEAEEAQLLDFAEQLNWQELISKLDDEQLAVAFQELEVAEAAAAAGDPAADKYWKASFVTALNHAALQGVAATAVHHSVGGSCAGDTHSEAPSSASQIRRAEDKASRRQKLLDRLTRLQRSNGSSVKGGSVPNGMAGPGSIAGTVCVFSSAGPAAVATREDTWDCSTRADGDGVRMVQQQLKVLEATDVLGENPEMRGVHSVASVMAMLQKKEVQC